MELGFGVEGLGVFCEFLIGVAFFGGLEGVFEVFLFGLGVSLGLGVLDKVSNFITSWFTEVGSEFGSDRKGGEVLGVFKCLVLGGFVLVGVLVTVNGVVMGSGLTGGVFVV